MIAVSGAALVGAALLTPQRLPRRLLEATGEIGLTARLVSDRITAGTTEQDIAVTITAPQAARHARPPVSLAVVIDRSGSMTGEPIETAKAAARELIDELAPGDAFTIVSYSSGETVVSSIALATPEARAAAHDAIGEIMADGGTCISCGLSRGAAELAHTPVVGGVRRLVVISDGQANEGVFDRGELAQLAEQTAARGISISAVGLGLDFDELTMQRLAAVGHGNYYFAERSSNLSAMFGDELGGLTETVASGVQLIVAPAPGISIDEAYGYPLERDPYGREPRFTVPIADLRAGETRKVVLHAQVTRELGAPADEPLASIGLTWRSIGASHASYARASVLATVVSDPAEIAAGIDRETAQLVEQARAAHVLEQATTEYEKNGARAAQRVLDEHRSALKANQALDPGTSRMLDVEEAKTADDFAAAPAGGAAATKAMKTARAKAYKLAR